jgi:hypothetical protein
MLTVHDIAKRAGIALIVLSRVINNSGHISDVTRKRVETTIKELGYVPNTLVRSLRSKQTNTLALMVKDILAQKFFEANDTLPIFQTLFFLRVNRIIWVMQEVGENRSWVNKLDLDYGSTIG